MYSKEKILKALSKVVHPEKGKDIVALGYITDIETGDDGISITITTDKQNDPFVSSIRSTAVRAIKEDLGPDAVIREIKVESRVKEPVQKPEERDILPGVRNILAAMQRRYLKPRA